MYRLISDLNFYRLTMPGLLHFCFFPSESWSPELDGETETHRAHKEEIKLTYERDFQTNPLCQIKPEGRPDLEVVLGQALTLSKSGFSHNRYFSKIRYFIQFAVFPSVHKSLESKLNKVNYYEIKCQ